MNAKTIFIIVISVLVTIILMNNTEEIDFWIFGDARVPKLAVLGSIFGLGMITGFLAGRPRKRVPADSFDAYTANKQVSGPEEDTLSEEDRDYIR